LRFEFEATGIGTLPHKSAADACRAVFDAFPAIPFWPQLPKRSFLENMYVQYSEGLPGLVLDREARSVHIETSKVAGDIEKVYQRYLDDDIEFFRISKEYAEGFYGFLEGIPENRKTIKLIKGQVTGPVSYALSVTDQNKRAVIYDKDLFEVLTKVLCMKARWQTKKMKAAFPAVAIFIDEPYLVSVGSSYVNIDTGEAAKKIDELIDAIKEEGALAGIHCCGNTDWSMLLKRPIDILSFDAYNFTKEFVLYAADIRDFLARGGTIAWGMVPSSDAAAEESEKTLSARLEGALNLLADKGIPKESVSSLITPSCGTGTLDEALAKKVFSLTRTMEKSWKKR
jgi:hypothetical protein